MKIQFISSKPIKDYGTTQLRCLQPAEYLRNLGYAVSVGNIREVKPVRRGVIFFHRTATNRFTAAYGRLALSKGNLLVYDSDDLTFDSDRKGHFLELCHAVSLSTDFLSDRCKPLHSDIHVIRNALSETYLRLADAVYSSRQGRNGQAVTIGYLSGSPTHDEDFLQVQEALLQLLAERTTIRVVLAGKLNPTETFLQFGDRFQRRGFTTYYESVNLYRDIDINIAPLDVRSAFANGRSELKFMEAGACGIPTVASPTHTYARIIKHGQNGMLASSTRDWKEAILQLAADPPSRQRMGLAARHQVLESYSGRSRAADYAQLIEHVVDRYRGSVSPLSQVVFSGLSRLFATRRKAPPASVHN